jgi:AraC family transcriptional regulator, alkane utilization regulator
VRLSGAVLFRGDFSAPWAVRTPPSKELAAMLLPGARQLLLFHLVAKGDCCIELDGHPLLRLETGDIVVFPYGDAHTMASDLSLEPTACAGLLAAAACNEGLPVIAHGGLGKRTELVCGFLHCDEMLFNPLCKGLPPLLHVKTGGEQTISLIAAAVRHMITETHSGQAGTSGLLARLSELLFIEVLRRYMAGLRPGAVGWLSALNDAVVGRALQLMHSTPIRDWTVDGLARQVGVSRSVLSDRFRSMLGQPPMHYLTAWRLQLAAEMLRDSEDGLAAIAARIGYDSEAAFNRAFKRYAGEPPAVWRAKQLAPPSLSGYRSS